MNCMFKLEFELHIKSILVQVDVCKLGGDSRADLQRETACKHNVIGGLSSDSAVCDQCVDAFIQQQFGLKLEVQR